MPISSSAQRHAGERPSGKTACVTRAQVSTRARALSACKGVQYPPGPRSGQGVTAMRPSRRSQAPVVKRIVASRILKRFRTITDAIHTQD